MDDVRAKTEALNQVIMNRNREVKEADRAKPVSYTHLACFLQFSVFSGGNECNYPDYLLPHLPPVPIPGREAAVWEESGRDFEEIPP